MGINILDKTLSDIARFTGSEIFNVCYEVDSKNLIHLHATLISKIIINPATVKKRGIRVYLELCVHLDDWLSYCNKSINNTKDVVNYFENNYGFISEGKNPPYNGINVVF